MKICHIVPISYLHTVRNHSRHLVLAPLILSNKKYRDFYTESVANGISQIIIDNGVFEDPENPATLTELVLAAYKMGTVKRPAPVVVLPDRLLDGKGTVKLVNQAVEKVYDLLQAPTLFQAPQIMAVVQGKTKKEFLDCYKALYNHPLITHIGIPHEAAYRSFISEKVPIYRAREIAITILCELNDSCLTAKPLHCLGLMGNPIEVKYLKHVNKVARWTFVESLDTSAAFVHAWNGVTVDKLSLESKKAKRPKGFFDLLYNKEVEKLFLRNVEVIQGYLKEEES